MLFFRLQYAGENFVRHTGDVREFAKEQSKFFCQYDLTIYHYTVFAWEAYEHGTDIHPVAEPTALSMMHQEFLEKKDNFKTDLQQSILDKYGGEEHLEAPPKELLLAQTVSIMIMSARFDTLSLSLSLSYTHTHTHTHTHT